MKFRFIPLLFLCFFCVRLNANAQNKKYRPFEDMIGQSASYPPLAELLFKLDSGQTSETFTLSLNEYEIRSYENGVALIFNHNFVLKEIHLYDSGYLYTRYQDSLPGELMFDMKYKDFTNFKYPDYTADTFNTFVFNRKYKFFNAKVYFKAGHIELVKLIAKPDYIKQRDSELRPMWGMRIIPDGKCVSGNCFKGEGTMEWPGGLRYSGSWESGTPHGKGSFKDSTGLAYSGEFHLGFLWGNGKLNMPKQYEYEGQFILGKRAGFGTANYTNGTRYEGKWEEGLMQGSGHFWYSETYHYIGEMVNNQFNGSGKLYTPEGYIEGSFKNGKPHGYCEQVVLSSHTSLSGYWVDGKKEGTFALHNPVTGTTRLNFENNIQIE